MSIITPDFLKEIRQEALRRRFWYKVLDKMERGIVNLTIKYVKRIRSLTLAKSIVGILKKIKDAGKSVFARRHEDFGLVRAVEVVSMAVQFGSACAQSWLRDDNLSLWLTLHDLNSLCGVIQR